MKWREVVRFELAYQLRRKSIWVLFGLFLFPLFGVTMDRLAKSADGKILYNAPSAVAESGLLLGIVGLLIVAVIAGDAATRDSRTRLEPLMRAAPLSRAAYLGGRFAGSFLLAAGLMAMVPIVHAVVPLLQPEVAPGMVGPFRPGAYLQSYVFLLLPNAFVATALFFALATVVRHPMASWIGVALLLVGSQLTLAYVGEVLGHWGLATILDPLGFTPIDLLARARTPLELNGRLIGLTPPLLLNRLAWIAVACASLFVAYRRFEWRRGRPRSGRDEAPVAVRSVPVSAVSDAPRDFGPRGRIRQSLAVVRDSLREIAPRWTWPVAPVLVGLQMIVTTEALARLGAGTPVLPATPLVVQTLGPAVGAAPPPVILAAILLPIVLAGELVWRERDANVAGLVDAAPVPNGVRWTGKLVGLWLVIVGIHLLLALGGMLAQVRLGSADIQPLLWVQLLGLELVTPLLFSLFALAIHVLANHKYVGHVLTLALTLGPLMLAEALGVEHPMLLLGFEPDWSYSAISGFEPFLAPLLSFRAYWAGWAFLLASVSILFWVRGEQRSIRERMRLAAGRFTGPAAGAVAGSAAVLLLVGGFVFYNTNVRGAYASPTSREADRAAYERWYGRFAGAEQPDLVATELSVELYPDRREATVRGVHKLLNRTGRPLDTLHVATSRHVETVALQLDRPATPAVIDDALGHRVYVLDAPLQPGDSVALTWEVRYMPRGFPAGDASSEVVGNGSFVVMREWMPLPGYQPARELTDRGARRRHGLPERPAVPRFDDPAAPFDAYGMDNLDLTVTVGTAGGQTALAPGRRVREWTENGRNYFRYETTAPVGNGYAIFSADYAVTRSRWRHVDIEVLHDPAHSENVPTMIRGMEASLARLSKRFGPYPYDVIRMVEYPAEGGSLHAASATIWYGELFSLFDASRDPRRIDLPFAVVAHEVAHQFQPTPARMEGSILLSESFAWYAALGVIEEEYGAAHLRRVLDFMRASYLRPRSRADVPLLRATDAFQGYRKGPFAMYALREYVGQERVDLAWRRLRERHAPHRPPFATSSDLYRELRAVTPDSLHTLLEDLLARNTFWELRSEGATVEPAAGGTWRVQLEVEARKVTVDTLGLATERPMHDLVEIGAFGAAAEGEEAASLYLDLHPIRSGTQTITFTVPGRPERAGVDPRHLLIDVRPGDNVVDVVAAPATEK